MKNDFNFCPKCGSKKVECIDNRKWVCPDCDFYLYNNVAAAVGIIIYDKQKNILFEKRAREPKKGFLDLPGGFVDFDETAEEALIRECREEMGIKIKDFKFLCTGYNTYPYKNFEYKTCDVFFTAEIADDYTDIQDFIDKLVPEDDEVTDFTYCKLETKNDVESCPLAFGSAKNALLKFITD